MDKIACIAGGTQIQKILEYALAENTEVHINAVVFIGDTMEEEPDTLCALADKLNAAKVPVFVFHEHRGEFGMWGIPDPKRDAEVVATLKQIAERSGGQYFLFNANSPAAIKEFADKLNAVAALAIGDSRPLAAIGYKGGTNK